MLEVSQPLKVYPYRQGVGSVTEAVEVGVAGGPGGGQGRGVHLASVGVQGDGIAARGAIGPGGLGAGQGQGLALGLGLLPGSAAATVGVVGDSERGWMPCFISKCAKKIGFFIFIGCKFITTSITSLVLTKGGDCITIGIIILISKSYMPGVGRPIENNNIATLNVCYVVN